jgi:hypothetical protein
LDWESVLSDSAKNAILNTTEANAKFDEDSGSSDSFDFFDQDGDIQED